ncbi:MAG: YIP1 family protein [Chloroflexaceae bacterium]
MALRRGAREQARVSLLAALRADPGDARAWLSLSGAVDDPAEQRYCLEQALDLDPRCAPARQGVAMLSGISATPPAWVADLRGAGAVNELTSPTSGPAPSGDAARPAPGAATPCPGAPENNTPPLRKPEAHYRPWRAIWRRPRAALRAVARTHAPGPTGLRAALAGVSAVFAWAAWRGLGAEARPWEVLAIALVAGPPLGLTALICCGVLLRTSGRWLGGHAEARQVRAVLALATVPVIAGLPLWLGQLALFPAASFGGSTAATPLSDLFQLIHGLLWLWAGGLSIVGLAEAHGITLWRAAATWVVAVLLVVGGGVMTLWGAGIMISMVNLIGR